MTIALTRPFALTTDDGTVIGYRTIGSGEGLILVGGAALTARDYLPLAQILALSYTVHVLDRRGRGASGPQGPGYSIETECRDLLALQRHTGATLVFGHGYGGLIALETARRWNVFRKITVYEPGLSIDGSIPLGWLDDGTADRYADIGSPVMLLGGSMSPAFSIAGIDALNCVIPGSAREIVDGLGHNAPARKPPLAVAQRILRFLRPPSDSSQATERIGHAVRC
jgi:pimeloyl-ACP methyl ester carboxylesterase